MDEKFGRGCWIFEGDLKKGGRVARYRETFNKQRCPFSVRQTGGKILITPCNKSTREFEDEDEAIAWLRGTGLLRVDAGDEENAKI